MRIKNNIIKIMLLIILGLTSWLCFAAIYTTTDSNGHVTYSDTPVKNSTVINAPPTSRYQAAPVTSSAAALVSELPNNLSNNYTTFAISSPTDQQTFQNQRDVPITLQVDPALRATDKIRILLDGSPYGAPESKTTFSLLQVDRGMHQIAAELLDANQTVIKKTPVITIYIHYAAVGGQ